MRRVSEEMICSVKGKKKGAQPAPDFLYKKKNYFFSLINPLATESACAAAAAESADALACISAAAIESALRAESAAHAICTAFIESALLIESCIFLARSSAFPQLASTAIPATAATAKNFFILVVGSFG
jgi:hypothetical protein